MAIPFASWGLSTGLKNGLVSGGGTLSSSRCRGITEKGMFSRARGGKSCSRMFAGLACITRKSPCYGLYGYSWYL